MVGKHNRHTSLVMTEMVLLVNVIMGEHEVKAITVTAADAVARDVRMVNKFKINAVSVVSYLVVDDVHACAFPAMDGISHQRIEGNVAGNVVTANRTVGGILKHQAELIGAEHAIPDRNAMDILPMKSAKINIGGTRRVNNLQPFNSYTVRLHLDNVSLTVAIDDRKAHTLQGDTTCYLDALVVNLARINLYHIAVTCQGQRAGNADTRPIRPNVNCATTYRQANKEGN